MTDVRRASMRKCVHRAQKVRGEADRRAPGAGFGGRGLLESRSVVTSIST